MSAETSPAEAQVNLGVTITGLNIGNSPGWRGAQIARNPRGRRILPVVNWNFRD